MLQGVVACADMCIEVLAYWNGLLDERLMKGLGLTGVRAGEMDR